MKKQYSTEQRPDETLEQYYRRLAKTADQRLVRLEKLEASGQEGFSNVTKWSYSAAMKDIQAFDGENAKRFNTAPPLNKKGEVDELKLNKKISAIKNFLESKSSTKSSILSSYNAKAKSFNAKYGTNLTWQEVGKAYESKSVAKLDSSFGSDTIAKAIATIKNRDEEQRKHISKEDLRHIKTNDIAVNRAIQELLADEDFEIEDLFGWDD